MAADPDDERRELEYLRQMEPNYRVAMQALAVAVEKLLGLTGGTTLDINDYSLQNCPDLIAARLDAGIRLSTSR